MALNTTIELPRVVIDAAARYGYTVYFDANLGFHRLQRKAGKPLAGVEVKKGRLRMFIPDESKTLLFSGGVTSEAMTNFLQKFYFAQALAANE